MIRRDYLVRQFEDFGKVIAKILGFRQAKAGELMEAEIQKAVQKYTDLEIETVERLDQPGYFELIRGLDDERLKILGDLLFEKMHFYIMREDDENFLLLKYKSVQAYELLKARTPDTFNMDVHYRLQYLEAI